MMQAAFLTGSNVLGGSHLLQCSLVGLIRLLPRSLRSLKGPLYFMVEIQSNYGVEAPVASR